MSVLRVIADGLVVMADRLGKRSEAARLLRDAAASLLDAEMHMEREKVQ